MKKKLLFVIDSLHCAGAEKSLITLLSLLDYSSYSVDLMLFAHGGLLESLVPNEVNILKSVSYMEFSKLSLKKSLLYCIRKSNISMFLSRIKYSLNIRIKEYNNVQKARMFWETVSNIIEDNTKEYDIAISYAQGIPTYYVADKVRAKKKLAWVNASYKLEVDEKEKEFISKFYSKYNKIVAVSNTVKQVLLELFPGNISKIEIIHDIYNSNIIFKMANEGECYKDNFNGIKILTIGRLEPLKGYDIALEACKKLIEKGIRFKWYVLGIGPLKQEIETYIKENNLSDHFVLLGVKSNPYPYIKNCDIYIQTSRSEGFGLAIAEARMLNKPVVATRFDSVYNQMIDKKNGLVVDMNSHAVYEGILSLINDIDLRNDIIKYLKSEKKGNIEEIEKFYKLIG